MELHPDNIKENIDQIGKKEGLALLKEWIDSSTDPILRQRALENYGSLDNGKNFKFFEHLFLSDEDIKIRIISGQILKDKYSSNKKLVSLLAYALDKVDNVEQQLFVLKTLNSINNSKTRKVLIDSLVKLIMVKYKNKIDEFPKDILNFDFREPFPEVFEQIFISLVLNNYYVNKCGYHVTLRKGKIISLNCESSNLNSILEITELQNLTDLEHLHVHRNNLRTMDGLEFLQKLRSLDLSYNNIEKIQNLENLIQLVELNLSNNKIRNIENLDSLENLKRLFLNNNQIEEISNLKNLSKLEELTLNYNHISEIKNLEGLTNLTRLNLSFNQIKKMTGLSFLENLMWLYLNDNKISQIDRLSTLSKLKGLYLSSNFIEIIESLENVVNLRKLELSSNRIKKIEGLNELTNLQELYLDNNNIQKIEGLENLASLIMLHLGRNKISNYRNENVEDLKNLNFLFLNENPLDQKSWEQFKKRFKYP